jgi:hypothetical protein
VAVQITAGFFQVSSSDESNAQIEELCSRYAKSRRGDAFVVQHEFKEYRLTDANWSVADRALSGTLWRVRESELPSKLRGAQASALNIQPEENLGEPASFAYIPSKEIAVVQYNHNGPRHSIVREFLYKAGLRPPLTMSPVLKQDALQRMRSAEVVRRIEFALAKPSADQLATLKQVGGAVKDALDAMEDVGGMTVRVTVSMGHNRGGLSEKAKTILESLSHGRFAIQTLKASLKESDEQATEMVDLLGGRQTAILQIPEKKREIDHAECRKRLLRELRSFNP